MDIKEILEDFSESQGENAFLYRNRPYRGQPHTDQGERGKTEIKGITFRDAMDAFVIGAMCAANDQVENFNERLDKRHFCVNDLFKLDWNKIDPLAVWQNTAVEMEKMMGIYPNVPQLRIIGEDEK